MPRFFFHAEDGHLFCDPEGAELPSVDAARAEGVRVFSEVLRDAPDRFLEEERFRLHVTDAKGQVVYQLDLNGGQVPSQDRRH